MKLYLIIFCLIPSVLFAEEKTCTIKGMECQGCVDMVRDKMCDETFAVCDIRIKDAKRKIGEAHLVTRDPAALIDPLALNRRIESTTYTIDVCRTAKR